MSRGTIIKENVSDYVTELLHDTCDYGWESAKGAHSLLLYRMHNGVLTWHYVKEIYKIRKCYVLTVERNIVLKIVPCLKIQHRSMFKVR